MSCDDLPDYYSQPLTAVLILSYNLCYDCGASHHGQHFLVWSNFHRLLAANPHKARKLLPETETSFANYTFCKIYLKFLDPIFTNNYMESLIIDSELWEVVASLVKDFKRSRVLKGLVIVVVKICAVIMKEHLITYQEDRGEEALLLCTLPDNAMSPYPCRQQLCDQKQYIIGSSQIIITW